MLTRRVILAGFWLAIASIGAGAQTQTADPLPSWNDGPAKQAILGFVGATTTAGSPDFVAPEARVATFDQDGTLWVEHPIYSQVIFALDRVAALAPEHPDWKHKEPFKTVLSGDREAIAKLMAALPELKYKPDLAHYVTPQTAGQFFGLFDPFVDPRTQTFVAEDYAFFRRWREACGGTVWCDLSAALDHIGNHAFSGSLGATLKARREARKNG